MNNQTAATSTKKQLVFRLLGVSILLCSFAVAWLMLEFQSFRRTPLNIAGQGMILQVKPGMSLRTIASNLSSKSVVAHPRYLILLGRYLDLDSHIKAGEYKIPAGVNPEEFLRAINNGEVIQHGLTLIEGETFKQLMQRINANPNLEHSLKGLSDKAVMAALDLPDTNPEGRFLPETYHFPRGMTDREFLLRAYQAMEAFIAQEWPERESSIPLKTPYEALILASIVEKETGKAKERPRIAGVFSRRLKKGMRLQTDPTVIYGLGENFDGDIRYRDLRTDTPYNSYTRYGLPPTPIAMPGKEAIRAVLKPLDDGALYFVARGDGSHYFSKTLKEHNQAVNRYQKKQK